MENCLRFSGLSDLMEVLLAPLPIVRMISQNICNLVFLPLLDLTDQGFFGPPWSAWWRTWQRRRLVTPMVIGWKIYWIDRHSLGASGNYSFCGRHRLYMISATLLWFRWTAMGDLSLSARVKDISACSLSDASILRADRIWKSWVPRKDGEGTARVHGSCEKRTVKGRCLSRWEIDMMASSCLEH